MIARVSLEIALRKEFDYAIPPELAGRVDIGSRVQVPFGPRKVLGVVTAVVETSAHTRLKPILKIIGAQTLVTPRVLQLARWIADYYCCAPEIALKSILPEAVRKEDAGWRERLFVTVQPVHGEFPKLAKRQQEVWNIVEERREISLTELVDLAETTAATVRKLEDRGLVRIAPQISERDPYAHEQILPTQPLTLNAAQAQALSAIQRAMHRASGVAPEDLTSREADTGKKSVLPAGSAAARSTGILPTSPFFNPLAEIHNYSGWLPHWRQADRMYFVTFRLADSVAQDQLRAWSAQQEIWRSHHPEPWDEKTWHEYHDRFTATMERMIDAGHGSCSLRIPAVADMVQTALHFFDGERYELADYVIMPNHVHVLVRPIGGHALERILHSWKSFTAKQANTILHHTGSFWRDESFDHLVRSLSQFEKFRLYIQQNPVVARLKEGEFRLGRGKCDLKAALGGDVAQRASGVAPEEPNPPRAPTTKSSTHQVLTVENKALESQLFRRDAGSTFLLHGVTGSGKTEIYLQAIAHALEHGKGAIVLVPEISLTPQTVERFKSRFSHGPNHTLVAVLHSHLSAGERHDEWHKIRQGRARIVIGARSAIFAPVEPLGLIVVDEEHEHTYKQEEAPRYNARDVAIMRGQMEGAVVVLGSATPSLESYHNCQKGKYQLLELPERVDDQKLPYVRVVDMRQAARGGKGPPIFSSQLKEAITQRLERGEQTILFLNRRGYSTALECTQCGYVAGCPNCSLALTYHRVWHQRASGIVPEGQTSEFINPNEKMVLPARRRQHADAQSHLRCHICGYTEAVPAVCPNPKCRNPAIRYLGLGTQKVEDTLNKLFPKARVQRMDSDILKRKEDYRRILGDFRTGKIDILIGTQMIAKGLHFPNVTLVGIIYADMALHQPDFRAGERTFQLLTQVAGRAGRGDVEGEVFVQAFTPFHPAIQYARRHDFVGFYEQEIDFRKQLDYPPFSRVALLTLRGHNEDKVKFSAEHVRQEIEKLTKSNEPLSLALSPSDGERVVEGQVRGAFKDLRIAGPAPAPLLRAENFYRYQIMLRTAQMSKLSLALARLMEQLQLPEDVTLTVDIDPAGLS